MNIQRFIDLAKFNLGYTYLPSCLKMMLNSQVVK